MNQTLGVLLSSKSNVWYTPDRYLRAVEQVFGGRIDLDPASDVVANFKVNAKQIFTEDDNGLEQEWGGNVFCNPPYGKIGPVSSQGAWANKMIAEYQSGRVNKGILLVNFLPGYKWFAPLWQFPICAVDHCIKFELPTGEVKGFAKASSAFIYMGHNCQKFYDAFRQFGPIVTRTY